VGQPDFASHIFGMSGVSGGSVGLSVFDALCAEKRQAADMRALAAEICGADHLAPTLGGLLYPDFVQRFLPVACLPDRARAFENSWEKAWRKTCQSDRMAQPFLSLWDGKKQNATSDASNPATENPEWLPSLFLNSTMVDNGKRVVCSNLPVRTGAFGKLIDVHDLHSHLRVHGAGDGGWQDVPLSAAAHTSARFPLVSPPGRLPSGARVVDGGYFENSAGATGLDLLHAVIQRRDEVGSNAPLIFIFFRYSSTPGLTDAPPSSPPGPNLWPPGDPPSFADKNALNETLSIAGALLHTRDARASFSQDAIFNRYFAPKNAIVLSFTFAGERIPLSWSLSQTSCRDIMDQFPVPSEAPPANKLARKDDPKKHEERDAITSANIEATAYLLDALYSRAR